MSHLDPWDLLRLSRVSRGFREILITPKAACLWKESIQSVGLPPCPDDITEPAYIAFVFDSEYCVRSLVLSDLQLGFMDFLPFQVCGNSPAPLLIPQLKMRLCAKCKSKQWVPSTLKYVAVDHIHIPSVQWFSSRAVGRLVTPSTLQGIAMNLVTPCQCCHRFCGNELLTHRFKSPWATITK